MLCISFPVISAVGVNSSPPHPPICNTSDNFSAKFTVYSLHICLLGAIVSRIQILYVGMDRHVVKFGSLYI